jgi:hypothetical protein
MCGDGVDPAAVTFQAELFFAGLAVVEVYHAVKGTGENAAVRGKRDAPNVGLEVTGAPSESED